MEVVQTGPPGASVIIAISPTSVLIGWWHRDLAYVARDVGLGFDRISGTEFERRAGMHKKKNFRRECFMAEVFKRVFYDAH